MMKYYEGKNENCCPKCGNAIREFEDCEVVDGEYRCYFVCDCGLEGGVAYTLTYCATYGDG